MYIKIRFLSAIFALTTFFSLAQNLKIIYVGHLINVVGGQVEKQKTIVVTNDIISDIIDGYKSIDELGYKKEEVELIDLKSKFMLPGLIDAHVHITGQRSDRKSQHEWLTKSDEDIVLNVIPYLKKTLQAGFTTVRDLSGKCSTINALKNAIKKNLISGPYIIASCGLITPSGGQSDIVRYRPEITEVLRSFKSTCDGDRECQKKVRELVRQGAEVIKIGVTGGVLGNTKGIDQQFSNKELKAIVNSATQLKVAVAAHAHSTDGINNALRSGVSSIEHGSFLDDESILLFKKNQAYLVPTLLAGVTLKEALTRDLYGNERELNKLNKVLPIVKNSFRKALKGKVNIAFGTDSGISDHGLNAKEFELMVNYGMSNFEAIKSATVNAAKLLNLYNRVGSIEIGKSADIIALNNNPLTNIKELQRVIFVMKSGKIFKAIL